jgi:Fe-S-cluster containining protein
MNENTIKFNCSLCNGICCHNPPQIETVEELEFALDNDAKVVCMNFEHDKHKYYFTVLTTEEKFCPFFDTELKKCKIYENRFNSCKRYRCQLYDKKINKEEIKQKLTDMSENKNIENIMVNFIDKLIKPAEEFKPVDISFTYDEIKKFLNHPNIVFAESEEKMLEIYLQVTTFDAQQLFLEGLNVMLNIISAEEENNESNKN